MKVVPAVSDATGIEAGPALFFIVFLATPVMAVVGAFFLYVLVYKWTQWVVDALRNL